MRKLELPIFEGEDAYNWIYRVERYFRANGVWGGERVETIPLCLEGKALAWYQWVEGRQPIRSWDEFKELLIERFRLPNLGTHYEQFLALTQEGTVTEYRERFELLSARLRGIPEAVLEGNFMKGLKPHIRAAIRVAQPDGLGETMTMAQLIDDKTLIEQSKRTGGAGGTYPTYRAPLMITGPKGTQVPITQEGTKEKGSTTVDRKSYKRLTDAEMADRRAKGLCFRCDERYTPGHRCKEKTLQIVLIGESDEENEPAIEEMTSPGKEGEEHTHLDSLETTEDQFGEDEPTTIKLEGVLMGWRVVVLIDGGATLNFISQDAVSLLGLKATVERDLPVMLGDGRIQMCKGIYKNLAVTLQTVQVVEDFVATEMGGMDMVLGVQWLRTLGKITFDYKELTLEAQLEGSTIRLCGSRQLKRICPCQDGTVLHREKSEESFTHCHQDIKRVEKMSVWDRLSYPRDEERKRGTWRRTGIWRRLGTGKWSCKAGYTKDNLEDKVEFKGDGMIDPTSGPAQPVHYLTPRAHPRGVNRARNPAGSLGRSPRDRAGGLEAHGGAARLLPCRRTAKAAAAGPRAGKGKLFGGKFEGIRN